MNRFGFFSAILFVVLLLAFSVACGGGGKSPALSPPSGDQSLSQEDGQDDGPELPGSSPIALLISASPSSGTSPLSVNLFVSATGGREPYEYFWDFENDGLFDANDQTPFHKYFVTSVAHVKVTDAEGNETRAYKTIFVNGESDPGNPDPLEALFGLDITAGPAPLTVHFEGFARGGNPPYIYRWDFDNDGNLDSFVQNPFFTFEEIGTPVDTSEPPDELADKWTYHPTLEVIDSVGRTAAFNAELNVVPASSNLVITAFPNPPTGQAPLAVDFDGGAEGGIPPYQFKWAFGDGEGTDWQAISYASHIYTAEGIYGANLTVRDSEGLELVSGTTEVRVENAQQLKAVIRTSVVNSSVPFLSHFSSEVAGGKEPFTFEWLVFSESTLLDDDVDPTHRLIGSAIVTPPSPNSQNPDIHFATVPFTGGSYDPIIVQLVLRDALGSETLSNMITITPQAATFLYEASHPPTNTFVGNEANFLVSTPSQRMNAAVVSHPYSGVTFMMGGEIVDDSGGFQGLTSQEQSAWAYNPNSTDFAYTNGIRSTAPTYPANSWVALNTVKQSRAATGTVGGIGGGAFPVGEMRTYPDGGGPARTEMRADNFIRRGSAAAIFVHEPIETNPSGQEGSVFAWFGMVTGTEGYPDNPFDKGLHMSPFSPMGYGVPVIYVIGGRDESGLALTTVQKYYPPGFGTELLPIDCYEVIQCLTGEWQITNNQVDIWRSSFLAPDRDYWPQVAQDPRVPIIRDRLPGSGSGSDSAGPLAPLPIALYGHSGFATENLPTIGPLDWPNGTYRYIYVMGGKEIEGNVSNEFRILDITRNPNEQGSGNQNPRNPEFPFWSLVRAGNPTSGPIQYMPVERYDFDLVVRNPTPTTLSPWQVYVFGGTNQEGVLVDQVDVFTFSNILNPTTGTWSTISSVLPEPVTGHNAAIGFDPTAGTLFHVIGGRTRDEITEKVYTLGSLGFVPSSITVIPKWGTGLGYSVMEGPYGGGITYYRVAGVDEQGTNPFVESFQIPVG